jgi:FkbM family methyltransferase
MLKRCAKLRLKLDQQHAFFFVPFGNIPKILYAEQPYIKFGKSFEARTLELFNKLLTPNSVILDVGANVGMYTLLFASKCSKGKVYSFEPQIECRDHLKKNLSLNQLGENVFIYPNALSDKDASSFLKTPEAGDAYSHLCEGDEDALLINTNKLDTVAKRDRWEKLDLIKIDIEGAELLFLKGAIGVISTDRPVIIMELKNSWTRRFGYLPFEAIHMCHNLGYVCIEYEFEQWLAVPEESRSLLDQLF